MKKLLKVAHSQSTPAITYDLDLFEKVFQLNYCPQLEYCDWKVEQWLREKCAWAHRKGKIGELGLWLGKLHGSDIDAASIPDVTIRWIHETIGYGLFSNISFPKWSFIGEYTGIIRRRNLFFPNVNEYCFMYPREWIGLRAFTIDSEMDGNFTRFINHSDDPNLESVSVFHGGIFHIIFRTIKEIPPGTELTYDYGDVYWRHRNKISD